MFRSHSQGAFFQTGFGTVEIAHRVLDLKRQGGKSPPALHSGQLARKQVHPAERHPGASKELVPGFDGQDRLGSLRTFILAGKDLPGDFGDPVEQARSHGGTGPQGN